ncbi:hypothetical protein ACFYVR_15850 [Rhodococcus sp. NPDC003318]|uniref:hypothetical protein n=1 Tax=Rhodococcus sp. NPDC003318 TaxID=3364503 RepID=UPI0036C57CC1
MSDNEKTPDDEKVVRPFADFLREANRGRVHDELTTQFHEVLAAVKDTGKVGSITLTLKISKQKKTSMIEISDDVKAKVPQLDRPAQVWFLDGNGNPTRNNPEQLAFESIAPVPDAKPSIAPIAPIAKEA